MRTSGTLDFEQYYLAEWRNLERVRRAACKYAVRHALHRPRRCAERGLHAVQRARHGPLVPGLGATRSTTIANHLNDPPSIGAKGTVARRRRPSGPRALHGRAAQANPSLLDALPARQQAMDAAFGPVGRYPFQACFRTQRRPGVVLQAGVQPLRGARAGPDVHGRDRLVPGLRVPPGPRRRTDPLFFRDARRLGRRPVEGQRIYSTRVTDRNGQLLPSQFGLDARRRARHRDRQPGRRARRTATGREDLSLGVQLRVSVGEHARPRGSPCGRAPGPLDRTERRAPARPGPSLSLEPGLFVHPGAFDGRLVYRGRADGPMKGVMSLRAPISRTRAPAPLPAAAAGRGWSTGSTPAASSQALKASHPMMDAVIDEIDGRMIRDRRPLAGRLRVLQLPRLRPRPRDHRRDPRVPRRVGHASELVAAARQPGALRGDRVAPDRAARQRGLARAARRSRTSTCP